MLIDFMLFVTIYLLPFIFIIGSEPSHFLDIVRNAIPMSIAAMPI